ncbi:HdeD family acid-resistance protein [Microvirga rosea]|uniref:HdeD family acid-resistance protein n=1 Tax=Microvirga rosea TaxID=2715425 RepID=UPI001D0B5933|nr:HdeD family acid-resistance protein [Microvirga rosea]MCB8822339.1 HdeD family acid-resistance protein [Microvirga rosea]
MAGGTSQNNGSFDRAEAMSALLAQNWWAVALRGVFAIIFALIALFIPGATLLSLVLFFAAYMLVDGIFSIVAAVRAASHHQRWGLLVLEGVVDILVGVIAFAWPGLTVVFFVTLMAVWSLITGVLEIVAAFKLNPTYGRGWLIFSGIVSILFGIALLVAPMIGAVVLTWWLGAYAMVFGITLLVLAFKLRSRKDTPSATTAMPRGA